MVHVYHNLFNNLSTEAHLGHFQVLAIINKAVVNIHIDILVWGGKSFNFFGINT